MLASHPAGRSYAPRKAGKDVLYQVLHDHLETFLGHADDADRPIPRYVAQELRSYLACGIPAFGFTWLICPACSHSVVVPFSCKGRGFCPSCGGRRMNQTAANLVDRVLPHVPIRQWVLSFPMPLRLWLAWRPELRRAVLAVVVRVLFGWYRSRARAAGDHDVRPGAVCFHQHFGSSLNLNLHFHLLVLDGWYVWDPAAEQPVFHEAPRLTDVDVARLVEQIRARVLRVLRRRGLLDDEADEPTDDGLFALQAASAAGRAAMGKRAGHRTRRLRLLDPRDADRLPRLCAAADWFNLHAGVRIRADDRAGLERLCRYVCRPALSHDRLSRRDDGLLQLRLKTPWCDGTTHLVLDDLELVGRLAALVPPPRSHLLTYHGVLAPAARWRRDIVPEPPAEVAATCRHRAGGGLDPWIPWHLLLKRTFGVDALQCPRCGGRLRVRAVVAGVWLAPKLLAVLGRPATVPLPLRARDSPSDAVA